MTIALNVEDIGAMLTRLADREANCNKRKIACALLNKHGEVLSTGVNGAPRLLGDCILDPSICPGRDPENKGKSLTGCYGIHAEIRALKDCKNIDAIRYLVSTKAPCTQCVLAMMTTPCHTIYFLTPSNETLNQELWGKVQGNWEQV